MAKVESDGVQDKADQLDKDATTPRKMVKYNGFSFEVRTITKEDWNRVGVEHDDVSWDKSNGWLVPLDDLDFLNETQMQAYISADPKFSVVEV